MESAQLYPPAKRATPAPSPLPKLLHTPSGLALLELQGVINLPTDAEGEPLSGFQIGRLEFPEYSPDATGSAWMKRVHLYVGQHQRLNGEVKKLPKALAVVRRREVAGEDGGGGAQEGVDGALEVVEIVKYKLMFSGRPEPVGTAHAPA
ncbi:Chromosome transmission fidelity protein-like protein [Hapsidospora chrysogenum ATCC 11550]|uniref:Chromosome transmission fidelity protein-like protein n=1 Tax=Hapsidospora chrysogenum (strain ATCC 11550 / CBS 779.69 / DSM 880 / IAM 14645 / JCM 23072 / IMI 49137) TaxID=857340 RepID=A0A086TBI9_HAPC1|nr:Chromosome transmission fidelity protein-like protein [Hapsidospora chrysogenum ATCC 11550]